MRMHVATSYDYNPPDYYTAPDEPPILYNDFNIVRVVRIYNLLVFLKLIAMFYITTFAIVATLAIATLTFTFLLDSISLYLLLCQYIPNICLYTL